MTGEGLQDGKGKGVQQRFPILDLYWKMTDDF